MGENLYDFKYYQLMVGQNTQHSEYINRIRWEFILEFEPKIVLDYGCGCNFLTIYAPEGVIVDSYDIGTINGAGYPQTGLRHDRYDLVFLNDVLEHVDWITHPDQSINEMLCKTEYVSVACPILPAGTKLEEWKHYKPNEHLTNFTVEGVNEFFCSRGFELVKTGTPECPPRQDVISWVFRREA